MGFVDEELYVAQRQRGVTAAARHAQ
jgi:hypothetical protein